jgi:ABC-type glutathione transport system ATPase component
MSPDEAASGGGPPALLVVRNISKRFLQGRWFARKRFWVTALDNVSLTIRAQSTLALVGESGAGKSTVAKCLAGLENVDSGEIWFDGMALRAQSPEELFVMRGRLQLVLQDSATALNPRFSAAEVVEEPLRIRTRIAKKERRALALEMMERVGVSPTWASRSALEFSGGQRQRLALARALILKPALLILDEALSGLDLSTQAQIVNLLLDFQETLSLTYLFITHDIALAGYVADEIAVMQGSKIVESGHASKLFYHPEAAYTRLLMATIPQLRANPSDAR